MPLFIKELLPQLTWAIWQIAESEAYFFQNTHLSETGKIQLNSLNGNRRNEWLASRFLLQQLLSETIQLEKDAHGKPYIPNHPQYVSISHTTGMVAAAVAQEHVGIDIQIIVEKMQRIATKFMNEEELNCLSANNRLEHLHLFWCAKEALFKSYGQKQLDWKTEYCIAPFEFAPLSTSTGRIITTTETLYFDVYMRIMNKYAMAYTVLKK